MEPHPIPQNVTSFQFKLIGDMTLKQFLYLAVGSAIAYFLFLFLTPNYPIVAWPLVIISASLGGAFAFLGVGSRPLDHWLKAFLKAIYSPTKRQWQKNGKTFNSEPLFNSRLVMYLSAVAPATATPIPAPVPTTIPAAAESLPTGEELKKTVELARQAQNLQMKIVQTERTLNQIKEQAEQPTPIPVDYSQQVNKTLTDLQTLVNQASYIKGQMESAAEPAVAAAQPIIQKAPAAKVIIQSRPKQAQIALTTFPNVISGVVKNKQENYLEGVIAVIYDKEGLPVRALKTNKLGQFTGSTPLPNGTYTLELERDDATFDVFQLELTGQVLPSLVITTKL